MAQDPAFALADHVAGTRFEDLPISAVEATKRDILDTYGCILGGSGAPGIADIFAMLDEWGGKPEARVLLHGRALPAPAAAMMNASAGHALDFDDTHDTAGSIHPGISVLAASLAMADRLGGVSGRDFVLAATLGLDVSCRIALASTLDRGWHRTAAIGIFGAMAAAGKLMGLTAAQLRHGLGIAYSHAAGNRQCILDGALTKRLQAGQAASGGVFSALLAARDFTGAHNIFTGRFGFLELYQPNGADAALLTQDLGRAFRGEGLSFKPYPCGRPLHPAIDAALAARQALGITGAADIAAVTIAASPDNHADHFQSGPFKRRPTQVVEAQFAQPFLVATALVLGRVGIGDVAGLGKPEVLALSDRIEGVAAPDRPKGWLCITVRHRNGREACIEATDPIGSPEKPLSTEQCSAKFRDNAANAVRPLAEDAVSQALERLATLETLPDVRTLSDPFA
ncbi:MAG: MmgE/PrpD family protein [Acetobacteraceae bacterium]